MWKSAWVVMLVTLTSPTQSAPPVEQVDARIEVVNSASRELVADGLTWALSSTAAIRVPGVNRAVIRDLKPGMNVRLEFVGDGTAQLVRAVTVLPD